MLKLHNSGQSFIYVAAFKQLGQKLQPSIPIRTRVRSPGKR